MSKTDSYKPGNPEYDYWNDKNLYPSLRHDDDFCPKRTTDSGDDKIGIGSVFVVIFGWILIMAPFALFFTWEDWIVQVVFWGGVIVIVLMFLMWICSIIEADRQKKE